MSSSLIIPVGRLSAAVQVRGAALRREPQQSGSALPMIHFRSSRLRRAFLGLSLVLATAAVPLVTPVIDQRAASTSTGQAAARHRTDAVWRADNTRPRSPSAAPGRSGSSAAPSSAAVTSPPAAGTASPTAGPTSGTAGPTSGTAGPAPSTSVSPAPVVPVAPGVQPAPSAHRLELGTTVFAMWRDWTRMAELFDRAAASGAGWVRVDLGWCDIEPAAAGKVEPVAQDRLDQIVAAAGSRHLQLLLVVGCTPNWAGGKDVLPSDAAQYQRVMKYLSARYRGEVAAWEIWNEPDCLGGCPKGSPEAYVPVLKAGFRGVRAGDPSATVVSGGISGNNVAWLTRMYAAGAQGYFDVLATHPYNLDPTTAPPDAVSGGKTYRLTTVAAVHDLMAANGDGAKSIWFTEWGWTTADTGDLTGVDEATQAGYLQQTVQLLHDQHPYVSNAFWFCLRDRDDWTPYENQFGLLHVDGTPKPSFAAMQTASQWLKQRS